jgi:hypothetical protein
VTNTERTLNSIIKYCVGAPSHSALSTVYMLAVEALEEYQKEQRKVTKEQVNVA